MAVTCEYDGNMAVTCEYGGNMENGAGTIKLSSTLSPLNIAKHGTKQSYQEESKGKGKGNIHPTTGHEGPEGE
jgi:hypothetical protein